MTETDRRSTAFFSPSASKTAQRWLRALIAGVFALAFAGLVVFLAAMLWAAVLVFAGLGLLAAAVFWIWSKVRGKRGPDGPEVLVATRGPKGWTVDGVPPGNHS